MFIASQSISFTLSFHLPPSRIRRCLFLQFSCRFLASNHMAKIVSSTTDSSELKAVASNVISKGHVMADGPLARKSQDSEGFISIPVQMNKKNVKNYSLLMSPSCTPFADKHPELKSSSCYLSDLTSPAIATTGFEHRKCKRRTRIDLGLNQASGHNCSVPSSNLEHKGLPLTKEFSTANSTKPQDESPQGCDSLKKKSSSVNTRRPYNSPNNSNYAASGHNFGSWKKKDASVNRRPYNSPNNSNYARNSHKFDASVSTPEFKPYDICFCGRRNPALVGATLHGENKESYIEMHEGETNEGLILRPGMVLLKNFIAIDKQVEIVKVCRELGLGPGGFYQPGYANGAKLRLKMMCLGLDWDPQTYKYGKKRVIDGSMPPSIPNHFSELVERAIQKAHSLIKKENRVWNVEDELPSMTPDICIVNFYSNNGKLGLHQDRDESKESLRKGLPVVSFSIGDSAEFLYGDERDAGNAECISRIRGCVDIWWRISTCLPWCVISVPQFSTKGIDQRYYALSWTPQSYIQTVLMHHHQYLEALLLKFL